MALSEGTDHARRFDTRIEALIVDLERVELRTDVTTCTFIGGSELDGIFSYSTRNCGMSISGAAIVEILMGRTVGSEYGVRNLVDFKSQSYSVVWISPDSGDRSRSHSHDLSVQPGIRYGRGSTIR
jgi:hypothetical protein